MGNGTLSHSCGKCELCGESQQVFPDATVDSYVRLCPATLLKNHDQCSNFLDIRNSDRADSNGIFGFGALTVQEFADEALEVSQTDPGHNSCNGEYVFHNEAQQYCYCSKGLPGTGCGIRNLGPSQANNYHLYKVG